MRSCRSRRPALSARTMSGIGTARRQMHVKWKSIDLRHRLRMFWTVADRDEAAALVNEILAEADARPYLARHDEWDWHLHVTRPDAPLADRIAAEAAMAFLDLIRADALGRLRICAAEDCEDVLIDLSKNSSKRYCDTGNCGNRTNVAAYRARKRLQSA